MNYVLILFLLIALISILHGMHVGALRMIYGIVAWFFVFWFINFATPYIHDYLYENTEISTTINEKITEKLEEKYDNSEEEQEGSGKDAIYMLVPLTIRSSFDQALQGAVDTLIESIAATLTEAAINGISAILAIIISYLIVWIVGKLIKLVGHLPGLSGANKLVGGLGGLVQGVMIIWIIMYIAECFPASALGQIILTSTEEDEMLLYLYNNNVIKLFM